jgi:hypothetical protein
MPKPSDTPKTKPSDTHGPLVSLRPGQRVLITLGGEEIKGTVCTDNAFADLDERSKDGKFHPYAKSDPYGRGTRVAVVASQCTALPAIGLTCPRCNLPI